MRDSPEAEPRTFDSRKLSGGDQGSVDQSEWADCWICVPTPYKNRSTLRHMSRGICERWHRSLETNGTCVICGANTDLT